MTEETIKIICNNGKQLELFSRLSSAGGEMDTASHDIIFTTCQTCFRKFIPGEMGKDGRYCKECEGNLNDEWLTMVDRGVKIKPGWVPRKGNEPHHTRKNKHNGNGNGTKELPIRKIKTMAAKGMKSSRIAAELIKQGHTINYRAIAGMVKGSGSNDRTRPGTKTKRVPTAAKAKPGRVSARR